MSFVRRFERLGDMADLNRAITTQQKVVRLTSDDHPDKPAGLINLGNSFRCRFERLGDIADLDEAITAQQQAIRLTLDGHPDKPGLFNDLGTPFLRRFERLGDIIDLNEAITAQQQAVHLTPDGHAHKPAILSNLGGSLRTRLSAHPDDATFDQAVSAYSQSAKSSSGTPSVRLTAARMWATLCFPAHPDETVDAYSALIDLLPRLVWLGRTVEQQHKDVSTIGDAVMDAAAAAIHFGQFDLALE